MDRASQVVGSPDPNLFNAMTAEHKERPTESTDTFITDNYGIETSSKVEWMFVVETEATDEGGLERWPVESEEKLPNRSLCRRCRPLSVLLEEAKGANARLTEAKQPETIMEEIVAVCMYTGPVRLTPSTCALLKPPAPLALASPIPKRRAETKQCWCYPERQWS